MATADELSTMRPDQADRAVMGDFLAPIDSVDIETRPGGFGKELKYIRDDVVMRRLDDTVGPENWSTRVEIHPNCVVCEITVILPSGKVLTRAGVGGYPEARGQGDRGLSNEDMPKAAETDAFKRAAMRLGIARHLRDDANAATPRTSNAPAQQGRRNAWGPGNQQSAPPARPPANGHGGGEPKQFDGPPKSGKGLFAWCRQADDQHPGIGVLRAVSRWGKDVGLPERMVDWGAADVEAGYQQGLRVLGYDQEGGDDAADGPAF